MRVFSFIKNSLLDYPGKICTTVFTAGCNFKCWYCHNFELIEGSNIDKEAEFFEFLNKRKGQIDAVVITGGEPTLQKGLKEFVKKVKDLDFLVKLDTNGLRPEVVEELLDENLLDYVAMDVKAPIGKYEQVIKTAVDTSKILKTIDILFKSNINYEFRTTFSPDLSLEDIEEIGKLVKGAKNFSLQNYRMPDNKTAKVIYFPHKPSITRKAYEIIKKYVPSAKLRGL